jgi:hypothetical protein
VAACTSYFNPLEKQATDCFETHTRFGPSIATVTARRGEEQMRTINMEMKTFMSTMILFALMPTAYANPVSRRATITGGGGNGRCTIEASVDHTAEVEIFGDTGLLTTTAGQPAEWRRFQCNTPMPRNPFDFRFSKISGRGPVRLVQDPRSTGGRAVIHLSDPQGGRANYAFDLQWGGFGGGGWTPGPPSHGPGPGGFPIAGAIRSCQESVTDRLNQKGYSSVRFGRTVPDNNPGRNDWISGTASAKRGFETAWFSFSCSVDFYSGRIRFVDVRHR